MGWSDSHHSPLGKVLPSFTQSQQCEAFGLVKRWELRSPPPWQAERQITFWSLSLLQLVSSYLLPNASISYGVEHLLSFENCISITHTGLPPWSELVLSPIMFQDEEEVRNVPDSTNIKYIPGEVSGHVCCTEISTCTVWARCTQRSCLHPSPHRAGEGLAEVLGHG